MTPFHVISGLPRSGSTLLAAILRHNPARYAHIASPVGSMVGAMLGTPGLHEVRPKAGRVERASILPPDLWARWDSASIWRDIDFNTMGVTLV